MMQSDAKYHLFNKLIINYKRGVAGNIVRKPGYIIGCFKLRNLISRWNHEIIRNLFHKPYKSPSILPKNHDFITFCNFYELKIY